MPERHFLVEDRNGRGNGTTMPLSEILTRWNIGSTSKPDDEWEEVLASWLVSARIGETFTLQEDYSKFTRTE